MRSVSVYSNSKGYYFKLDGVREPVLANQLWTTLEHVKMRGSAQIEAPPMHPSAPWLPWPEDEDDEERSIAAAIEASLSEPQDVAAEAPAAEAAPAPVEETEAPSGSGRECAICLTEPSNMLMRPCNHLIACGRCAQRLVRQPCPMCRRHVRSVERVFF